MVSDPRQRRVLTDLMTQGYTEHWVIEDMEWLYGSIHQETMVVLASPPRMVLNNKRENFDALCRELLSYGGVPAENEFVVVMGDLAVFVQPDGNLFKARLQSGALWHVGATKKAAIGAAILAAGETFVVGDSVHTKHPVGTQTHSTVFKITALENQQLRCHDGYCRSPLDVAKHATLPVADFKTRAVT